MTSQSFSVLFVTESPLGGTMCCHPHNGQGRGWWMVELVRGSDESLGGVQTWKIVCEQLALWLCAVDCLFVCL